MNFARKASFNRNNVIPLSIGILFGFGFSQILHFTDVHSSLTRLSHQITEIADGHDPGHGHEDSEQGDPHSHGALDNAAGPNQEVSMHGSDEDTHKGSDIEAQKLAQEVKVLCWIMTSPKNHQKKAIHVKRTWGKRCNKLLFMSSADNDTELAPIALPNVQEGRDYLWAKTKEAFKYVYAKHFSDADWFMKADDDTYVIVENLRLMLRDYDPNYPIYFGCRFKPIVKQGYMSGGAGYVLSKEALRRFVEDGVPNKSKCREDHKGSEDVEMGKCMQNLGVEAGDTRDKYGRYRFLPFVPEHHVIPGHVDEKFWYWKYIYYPQSQGLNCCSDTAISFHYMPPNKMYSMEYLLYHVRPYGINFNNHPDNSTAVSEPTFNSSS